MSHVAFHFLFKWQMANGSTRRKEGCLPYCQLIKTYPAELIAEWHCPTVCNYNSGSGTSLNPAPLPFERAIGATESCMKVPGKMWSHLREGRYGLSTTTVLARLLSPLTSISNVHTYLAFILKAVNICSPATVGNASPGSKGVYSRKKGYNSFVK